MISAAVHTYNEEKNIERCLSSLAWVDEIVVIDMGSKDKTLEIAKSYKAQIYSHPYTGFVEPARNFGIQKARGTWIFILDADEEVSKTLVDHLLGCVKDTEVDYYRIARKNIIFGKWMKHSGWWPDYQIRFFKKGYVSWSDNIHGVPLTKGNGQDIEATADMSLTHHNYQTLEQYIERLNRYTTISAKELYFSNKRFSLRDLLEVSTKEFINRYLVWDGYKDGIHGLALSFLQSFSEMAVYLKLWELENFRQERVSLDEIRKTLSKEQQTQQYWFFNALLNQPHNFLNELVWKLKRRLTQHG